MTPYGVAIDWEDSLGFEVEDLKLEKTSAFLLLGNSQTCMYKYIYIYG